MKNLLRREIRIIIPCGDEHIQVNNPTEEIAKQVREMIVNNMTKEKITSSDAMLEFLIKELTNVELPCKLDEFRKMDIGYEAKVMLFNITEILNELYEECNMLIKMAHNTENAKKIDRNMGTK